MRVLLLDDQPGSRKRLGALLSRPSIEKIEANDVESAIEWTRDVDLVIVRATFEEDADATESEVTLGKLKRLIDEYDAPFLVLTAEAPGGRSFVRLVQSNYVHVFAAPLDVPRFERTLETLLGSFRRASGRIADESLDELLIDVVKNESSGVLTVNRGAETRRVTIDRAKVVFCEDAAETFDCADEPSARAAWDAVLDLYLWPEGEWAWFGSNVAADIPCSLPIQLATLRSEGKRRQEEWLHVRPDLPPTETKLLLRRDLFPKRFPSGDRDRMLVDRIGGGGVTVGQIRSAWGRQEFAICCRLVELVRLGLIELEGVSQPRRTMEAMALAPFRAVRLLRSADEIFREKLTTAEAFLVSRISNGELLVEDVLSMCPVPWEEALRSLAGMIERGLVGVRDATTSEGPSGK